MIKSMTDISAVKDRRIVWRSQGKSLLSSCQISWNSKGADLVLHDCDSTKFQKAAQPYFQLCDL
jgi:hypothetical protein